MMSTAPRPFLGAISAPFRSSDHISPGLVAAYVAINAIVLFNAIVHPYGGGYDAPGHQDYIQALSHARLPTPDDTSEFFSAPLPYVPTALGLALLPLVRFGVVLKGAQLLQVLYALVLTLFMIRLCRRMRPDEPMLPLASICLLGMLPVYYRTMAFVRGEALAACLAVVCLEQAMVLVRSDLRPTSLLRLGILLGLLILAKQWAVFVFGAILLWLVVVLWTERPSAMLRAVGTLLLVTGIVGAWFYLSLAWRFGSIAAFNQPASSMLTPSNRPATFYTDLRVGTLFRDPVRPAFDDQPFLPLFYADTWGDYWCYWVVYGAEGAGPSCADVPTLDALGRPTSNRAAIHAYLGRVNLVSLLPSAVYLGGGLWGLWCVARLLGHHGLDRAGEALLALAAWGSLVGYLLLLVRYPDLDVKASYMLQVFPLVAILGGAFLCRLKAVAPHGYAILVGLLALCLAYDAPVFVTRYLQWGGR